MHGRNEPITATCESFDESRIVGGIAQSIAQTFDRGVETMFEIDERVRRPEARL